MYPFVRCCRMLFANADVDERLEMITMIIETGGFDDIIKEDYNVSLCKRLADVESADLTF